MSKYGYLHQPDPRDGTMLSNDDVTFAVKNLQHVRGLKETGSLQDPDTVSLVDGKRCAVPDFGPADNARRKRRYATHGTAWNKTVMETHCNIVTGEILIKKQIQIQKIFGKILGSLGALIHRPGIINCGKLSRRG